MMNEIAWRGFRFEVPKDWEMLQFGRRTESGKCCFADRYDQRMEWNWKRARAEPDLLQTVKHFVTQEKRGRKALCGKWIGVETEADQRVSRYLRHFNDAHCTVEFIFSWPERRDEILMRQILDSVQPESTGHWRAFGLDVRAARESELLECEVMPAMARAKFVSTDEGLQEEFQRLGMVSEWLAAPVRDWLRRKVPARLKAGDMEREEIKGHEVEKIQATGAPFPRIIGRKTRFHGAAWICPQDGRLYYHGRTVRGDNSGGRISCCSAYSHG